MSFFSSKKSQKSAASSVLSSEKGKNAAPPTSEIFTSPLEGCVPKKKWEYDDSQKQMIEELKQYTQTQLLPESDPYHSWEARFLADPGCHPRYCRAAKWKLVDAKTRIKGTLEWRREFKPELIEPGDVGVEAETGKIILTGFDVDARPILYMRPGRENTERGPRQIRHLIYHLERAIDFMPPGQEQVAIIIDYKSATSQTNPSIGVARQVLNILQNHYVERLGRGLVVNMSWFVNAFFSAITPFLDPITRDKVRFNPVLTELVPEGQLDSEFGGLYNFDFDHKVYWSTLTEFCHLAPDGSRINKDGSKIFPPLGNGIKAATSGLVPVEGAFASGQVTKAEMSSPTPQRGESQTRSQRIAAEHRQDRTSLDESGKAGEDSVDGALVGKLGGVSLNEAGVGEGRGSIDGISTKPGPPAGDIVFDHKPSKTEMVEARQSREQQR